jgi:hypothetical protein
LLTVAGANTRSKNITSTRAKILLRGSAIRDLEQFDNSSGAWLMMGICQGFISAPPWGGLKERAEAFANTTDEFEKVKLKSSGRSFTIGF